MKQMHNTLIFKMIMQWQAYATTVCNLAYMQQKLNCIEVARTVLSRDIMIMPHFRYCIVTLYFQHKQTLCCGMALENITASSIRDCNGSMFCACGLNSQLQNKLLYLQCHNFSMERFPLPRDYTAFRRTLPYLGLKVVDSIGIHHFGMLVPLVQEPKNDFKCLTIGIPV